MALKKNVSFDELVRLNREQIMKDRNRISEIEETIDKRMDQSVRQNQKKA